MNKITIPLWKNTSKNTGNSYLVGKIGFLGLKVMIFENKRKEKPNQPDFNLVITRDSQEQEQKNKNFSNAFDEIPF